MKTVHGAEFYANKKHKGIDGGSEDGPAGLDSSPRSEDMQSHKTASLSSPSIKSEVSKYIRFVYICKLRASTKSSQTQVRITLHLSGI